MGGKAVLTGNLKFTSLADLFQIIGGNNSTGTLRITSQYVPQPGIVHFLKGNPVNAANGPLKGLDAVYSLFGRTEGNFEFSEEKLSVEHAIKKNRMEIVLDALRMLDDGVIEKVGPTTADELLSKKGTKSGDGQKRELPLIKGPAIDYLYILDEEEFSDGKTVVKEGSHGKWIWVILDGAAQLTRGTSRGPLTIAKLGEGCFIGSFTSLLFQEYARSATVSAIGDLRVGLLDTQRLAGEFYTLPADFRNTLSSLDRRLKKITDRAVDLSAKKEDSLSLPTKGLEVVVDMGSKKDDLYCIQEGQAYVVGKTAKGALPLLTLEKDDVFGNLPFMDMGQEPRNASVAGTQSLKTITLDAEELHTSYDHLSQTFKGMIFNICTCVSITTKLVYLLSRGK
jgi:CRP-like cAMP-binding protein